MYAYYIQHYTHIIPILYAYIRRCVYVIIYIHTVICVEAEAEVFSLVPALPALHGERTRKFTVCVGPWARGLVGPWCLRCTGAWAARGPLARCLCFPHIKKTLSR